MIPELVLKKSIDLTNARDLKYLTDQAADCGDLASLIRNNLEDYLEYFAEPCWHEIGAMGTYQFYTHDKKIFSKDIREMLILTKKLDSLKRFEGFEHLLVGFKNMPQIYSTIFEVNVGYWCQSRSHFHDLIFSPLVNNKIPEFIWVTKNGEVFCECKRVAFNESKFQKLASKVLGICKNHYDAIGGWPTDIRIDIGFDGKTTNNIDKRIYELLKHAKYAIKKSDTKSPLVSTGLEATIRKRNEQIPRTHGELVAAHAVHEKAGRPSKLLEDIQLSINIALENYEVKAVQNMINKARKQLPKKGIGAIFIETSHALQKIKSKVSSLISQDAYANTPLISLWIQGEPVFASCTNGYYFDENMFNSL